MSEDKTPPEDREPTLRAKRVSELFQQAWGLDAAQREAFLDEACARDSELRAEVASLFALDDTQSMPEQARRMLSELGTVRHPTGIGPYKILEVLGEGGMGIVYAAEQEKPAGCAHSGLRASPTNQPFPVLVVTLHDVTR